MHRILSLLVRSVFFFLPLVKLDFICFYHQMFLVSHNKFLASFFCVFFDPAFFSVSLSLAPPFALPSVASLAVWETGWTGVGAADEKTLVFDAEEDRTGRGQMSLSCLCHRKTVTPR